MSIKRWLAEIEVNLRKSNRKALVKKEQKLIMSRNKALKQAAIMTSLADKLGQEHEAILKRTEALDKLKAEKARLSSGNPQWGKMGMSLAKGLKKFGGDLKTGNAAISKWAKASREKNMPQYFDK